MFDTFYSGLLIVWILDILNMPFMKMMDTTYPINEFEWFLIIIIIVAVKEEIEERNKGNGSKK